MGHANVDDSGGLRNRKMIVQGNTMKEAASDDWEKREGGRARERERQRQRERALLRFQGKRKQSEEEM